MIDEKRRSTALLWLGSLALSAFALLPYYCALRTSLHSPLGSTRPDTPYVPLGRLRLDPDVRLWEQFAFARLDLAGRRLLFAATVFTPLLPPIVPSVPVYGYFTGVTSSIRTSGSSWPSRRSSCPPASGSSRASS